MYTSDRKSVEVIIKCKWIDIMGTFVSCTCLKCLMVRDGEKPQQHCDLCACSLKSLKAGLKSSAMTGFFGPG